MIIHDPEGVTAAVLQEIERTPDPRLREILSALVRHLHDFVREVRLSEDEFRTACAYVAALGQHSSESHNETVLMAGSLGVSTLVCLLNNGQSAASPADEHVQTTANLLGPFWRTDAPRTENGGSIVRSPTAGEPLFVTARVEDLQGQPVAGAEVDVWQSSAEGLYENQDSRQADMNLRGRFVTDEDGRIRFRAVKPRGYAIPVTGPVGEMLRAVGRHNMRPAHVHFMIYKPGYKTHISQVYASDDPFLETDVQFGVTAPLVADYVRHEDEPAPYGDAWGDVGGDVSSDVSGPWYSLEQTFRIEPGVARWPRPPITGKAGGS